MISMKITSIAQLEQWNNSPTEELPDLYSWFFDYFFEDLLMKDKVDEAKKAHEEHIKFAMICEKFSREDAVRRVNSNLGYYAGYSTQWEKKLSACFPQAKHPIFA